MDIFNDSNCTSKVDEAVDQSQAQSHLTHRSKALSHDVERERTKALPGTLDQWAANVETISSSASVKRRSLSNSTQLHELYALQALSQVGEVRKWQDGDLRKELLPSQPSARLGAFADPLSPLRERDLFALEGLFQRSDMYWIEADVNQMLLHLLPEPCWDEDAFDFLHEFL
jgi:hypothetical protein